MVERLTVPTKYGNGIELRTDYGTDTVLKAVVGNGAMAVSGKYVSVQYYGGFAELYLWGWHGDDDDARVIRAAITLEPHIARRVAVWLSHHDDRFVAE